MLPATLGHHGRGMAQTIRKKSGANLEFHDFGRRHDGTRKTNNDNNNNNNNNDNNDNNDNDNSNKEGQFLTNEVDTKVILS